MMISNQNLLGGKRPDGNYVGEWKVSVMKSVATDTGSVAIADTMNSYLPADALSNAKNLDSNGYFTLLSGHSYSIAYTPDAKAAKSSPTLIIYLKGLDDNAPQTFTLAYPASPTCLDKSGANPAKIQGVLTIGTVASLPNVPMITINPGKLGFN